MNKLNCGVIGVGYLGRFHAQKYKALENTELKAVCDSNLDTTERVATELDVPGFTDFLSLLPHVEAVSIAATTKAHYDIARECLLQGKHVLLEKPITETTEQARELVDIANKKQLVLQVGHLERFNSARIALDEHLDDPRFVDSERLAPFSPRGADVNVILDLMIHDIDLLQSMIKAPIVSIDAHGTPVLTKDIDIANARLQFDNGTVANVSASRVSFKRSRKMRIYQPSSYLSVDFAERKFSQFKRGSGELFPGIPDIEQQEHTFAESDALLEEIKAFTEAIINQTKPLVSGQDGLNALQVAHQITDSIKENSLMASA